MITFFSQISRKIRGGSPGHEHLALEEKKGGECDVCDTTLILTPERKTCQRSKQTQVLAEDFTLILE